MTNSLASLKVLQDVIASDEHLQAYHQMGIKVHENERIKAMYATYLKKQREVVKLSHYKKTEALKLAEQALLTLENELYEQPLLNDYLEYQREINELSRQMSTFIQFQLDQFLQDN